MIGAAGGGSAGMSVQSAAQLWNELVIPMGKRGTLMGSPSMCSESIRNLIFENGGKITVVEQADEDWLTPFGKAVGYSWNFTAIHVNKNNMDGVRRDIVRNLSELSRLFPRFFDSLQRRITTGTLTRSPSGSPNLPA